MTNTEKAVKPTGAIQVEMEITIAASKETVWKAFIDDIGIWWHKDFYASKAPSKLVIEPRLGGMMYEDTGNGAGMTWFTIVGLVPGESIYAVGYARPPHGGPSTGLVVFSLEEKGENETVFKVSDSTHGVVSEKLAEEAGGGWTKLFTELKTFVEKNQ